ncbi:hypothetical protein FAZ19_05640 [Sphingobacterium alkalisoli]|uniref:Uncharacterized protein n=1 Tax=Sphingobacterium alkalisoli TaxID=1874115 RepID=A0A4U0HAA5_9SPHI|nr:hypothetical protein [Sphingobacterium alkalisoli]TJY68736.1 hypothetical protein FAZ19_05640 [Sphingobacterium alkalisoli]
MVHQKSFYIFYFYGLLFLVLYGLGIGKSYSATLQGAVSFFVFDLHQVFKLLFIFSFSWALLYQLTLKWMYLASWISAHVLLYTCLCISLAVYCYYDSSFLRQLQLVEYSMDSEWSRLVAKNAAVRQNFTILFVILLLGQMVYVVNLFAGLLSRRKNRVSR